MKQVLKTTFGLAAAAAVVATTATPAVVSAYGDNLNGRPVYTIEDINAGKLGNKITLNSITNNPNIGDERNFVGARVNDGNNQGWYDEITVEEGKTYLIRLYVHNNNTEGVKAIAKDVTASFSVPGNTAKQVQVDGYITSSNASPSKYWDDVVFKSDRNFYLDYIEGSAKLENNGIGKSVQNGGKGPVTLSDNVISAAGVKLGYETLDGNVPGCFQYANYVTIEVKPVFGFMVETQVRHVGTKEWKETIEAKVGDKVEFQIHYRNTTNTAADYATAKAVLPKNLKIVNDTTKVYNATQPDGKLRQNTLTTGEGVDMGGYAVNGDGYVRFTAEVVDTNLVEGKNLLVTWGQVGTNEGTFQDPANVSVTKASNPKDEPTTPVTPTQPTNPTTPSQLPTTGPAAIAAGVVGAGALVAATGYYLASRKSLR